jgi:hypothetical protein
VTPPAGSRLATFLVGAAAMLAATLAAMLAPPPPGAHAQDAAELEGVWWVHRAGGDDLALRLEVSGPSGTLRAVGRLRRWAALPDALARAREPLPLEVAADGDAHDAHGVTLRGEAWTARLLPLGPSAADTALLVLAGAREVGVARRLRPVPSALRGDWERAEPHPTGPRVRTLRLLAESATFWDSRGAPTRMRVGVQGSDDAPLVVLLPDGRSGGAVRLLDVGAAFLAVELGGDELRVVFAPGRRPPWLQPEPLEPEPGGADSDPLPPTWVGDWLVGRGDGSRLTARLALAPDGGRWEPLARGGEEPVALADAGTGAPRLLALDASTRRQIWIADDGSWGALWDPDDDRYQALWRVVPVPEALLGDWRLVGPEGDETAARVTADALWRDDHALPVVGVLVLDGALGLAELEDDRAGRLRRLWPLSNGDLVADDATLWRRPP